MAAGACWGKQWAGLAVVVSALRLSVVPALLMAGRHGPPAAPHSPATTLTTTTRSIHTHVCFLLRPNLKHTQALKLIPSHVENHGVDDTTVHTEGEPPRLPPRLVSHVFALMSPFA
ncbi:hypothetical protein DPSP01_006229 [Paraphaeosphaeria sporulosa]